ncbi:MAG: sigma-70 family RNA polymerase sigma factor [Byssovorax sp.]
MTPEDAAPLVRRWFEQHGRLVAVTLARYGVKSAADRAELRQEVFILAFLTLLRGEVIDAPGVWLKECARRKASNHRRKEILRASFASENEEGISVMPSPAQLAEDREALNLAFECLDEPSQDIVLAVRADGLSWGEVAAERGISVARARYLYALAVTQMEVALKREDEKNDKHRAVAFPILLAQVFDAIRAEVDATPPELDRQVREGLKRFMKDAGASAPEPESERVSVARPTPPPIQNTPPPAPSTTVGPVLGIVGGGVAIGILLVHLLHGASPAPLSPDPSHGSPAPAIARIEPSATTNGELSGGPSLPSNQSTTVPEQRIAPSRKGGVSRAAADRLNVAASPGSQTLIDHARADLRAGNATAALALLTLHAQRFPAKADEGDRPELLRLVCADASVCGEAECADGLARNAAR